MKKVSLGVWVSVLVLALGLTVADAQMRPPMGGMGGGMAGKCGGMMGPGMTGGPMMGRCGHMMTDECGCGMMGERCDMMDKGKTGRHMGMMGEMGMAGMHHGIWRHIMALALDQKQKAGIREIKTGLMKNMIRKKADLHIAMLELGELVHADKIDMKKVEVKVKQIEGLRSSMLLSGIEAAESVKSKLTAEQRKKLDDMRGSTMRCTMMGDDMMSGDEDMMGETPASPAEGEMEEAPTDHD